jgi:prephenate dehydrogenase
MKRVVLVGLGLIGGSIGLALRESIPGLEIVGVDSDVVVNSELARSLLTRAVAREGFAGFEPLARDADLIVLAMPVGDIANQIAAWLTAGVPVTDCGSTKVSLVTAASFSPNRAWFLPGHPMAGRERGGLPGADPNLFRGRRWIACPEATRAEARDVSRTMVEQLGAI